ncbi:hypothetical protein ALC56_04501 [Trachymyrmex septentrionalis]|uniref:Uncharacterized protein n=1 Tax=Trachymyrmex septentrionalis TaxID=34720 RepID=A0A195FN89_9HYME|nr:hypothetical protein ALC56_04501 [Trachymyrmex septentrionalis]
MKFFTFPAKVWLYTGQDRTHVQSPEIDLNIPTRSNQNDFDYGSPSLPDDPSVSRNPLDVRNHRDYSSFHLRSLRQSPALLPPPRRSHLSLRLPLLPPHPLDFDSLLSSTTSSSCDSESESDSVLVVSFSLSDDKSRARLLLLPRLRKLLLLGTISLLLTNRLEPLLAAVLLT